MLKDTYYFPHDYFPRQDLKMSAFVKDHGMEGYGIYWCIIELLHQQGGRIVKFPKVFTGIAANLNLEEEKIKSIFKMLIEDYALLKEDKESIYSDRVINNLKIRNDKKELLSNRGKSGGLASAEKRWGFNKEVSQSQQESNKIVTKNNKAITKGKQRKGKERKGKEIKGKEIKGERNKNENQPSPPLETFLVFGETSRVRLTQSQVKTLKARLSGQFNRYVEALDGWLAEDLKRHKDNHYQTILNWARKDGNLKDLNEANGLNEAERSIVEKLKQKDGVSSKDLVVDLLFEFPFNRDFIKAKVSPDVFKIAEDEVEKVNEENRVKFGGMVKEVLKTI